MEPSTLLLAAVLLGGAFILLTVRRGIASPEDVAASLARGALVVDVRTPGEFAGGHVKEAVNIPVEELARRVGELGEKGRPVVFYCRSGMRSGRAARMMKAQGWEDVLNAGTASGFPTDWR